MVGTHPEQQRRGLGRRVLQPGLDLAAALRIPAYLETSSPTNVEFYESLGFEATDHTTIGDDGPDVWIMERPTRTVDLTNVSGTRPQ